MMIDMDLDGVLGQGKTPYFKSGTKIHAKPVLKCIDHTAAFSGQVVIIKSQKWKGPTGAYTQKHS